MLLEAQTPTGLLSAIVFLLLGLVVAFAGFRLARGLAGFAGFLAGFGVGLLLGTMLGGPLVGLLVAIVAGIAFAILFVMAFRMSGGLLAAFVAAGVAQAFGLDLWLVIVLAIVAGIVGLVFNEVVLCLATAVLGAALASAGGVYLLDRAGVGVARDPNAFLVGALVLAALGFLAQFRAVRQER